MKFKLIPGTGNHAARGPDGEIVVYKAEDGIIIESDEDLAAKFVNKFERVEVAPDEPTTAPAEAPAEKPAPKTTAKKKATRKRKSKPKKAAKPKLGRDVTAKFPGAAEQDFRVFADGGAFSVVDKDKPDQPLHENPLHTHEVAPFMAEYLKT